MQEIEQRATQVHRISDFKMLKLPHGRNRAHYSQEYSGGWGVLLAREIHTQLFGYSRFPVPRTCCPIDIKRISFEE